MSLRNKLMDYMNGKSDLIPEETYEAVIIKSHATIYKKGQGNKGNIVEVQIRDDIHPEHEEIVITDYLAYVKGGMYKYDSLLRALPGGIEYMWDTLGELANFFRGQTVRIKVNHRKNDLTGRMENHICEYSKSEYPLDFDADGKQEEADGEETPASVESVLISPQQDSKWADQWEMDEWVKEQIQQNKSIEQDWEWEDQWSIDEWVREMNYKDCQLNY